MKNNIKSIFVKESIAFILNVKYYIAALKVKAIFFYRLISSARAFDRDIARNRLAAQQLQDPLSIPVIIVNFNQLYYLQQLVTFLLGRGFKNIVVIDNASTYPPLLEYYETIKGRVTIERRASNDGHMVFYNDSSLFNKYGAGFYILTDADIVPNEQLPHNFVSQMISMLRKYFLTVAKVGFALKIDDIPDHYKLKNQVEKWERQFWTNKVQKNAYRALTDTTFCLYRPGYKVDEQVGFYQAIRMAGNYTAKHGGWYIDYENLTEEQYFYQNTANNSSSWLLTEDGTLRTSGEVYN